jgi:hypothetical protein
MSASLPHERRARPEDAIQRAVVQHYQQRRAPGVFMFSVPNGGYRRAIEAAVMAGTGTVAGVPDTIWIKNARVYGLELKAPNGRVSASQLTTLAAMEDAGAVTCIADGLDAALAAIEAWGMLRGRSGCTP